MKYDKFKYYTLLALYYLAHNTVYAQPHQDIFSPTFSHSSGRYDADIQVELKTRTPGGVMYFTLDGTAPDSTSQPYAGVISIAGDENYIVLKAITISQDTMKSLISSAIYIIDYDFNPNASYLTNLTLEDYNNWIIGDWFGFASTPWTDDYCVKLSILPNGNYIDTTTSSCCRYYPIDDEFVPVFYNGMSYASPYKIITVDTLLPSGYANGFVSIDYGPMNIGQDELRYIKFIDSNNLYLEKWYDIIYGPLKYYLTNTKFSLPTGVGEHDPEITLIYPNPASDIVHIQNLNSDVQFINLLGQSFLVEKSDELSVAHLPRGLYILVFKNMNGVQVKEKILLE